MGCSAFLFGSWKPLKQKPHSFSGQPPTQLQYPHGKFFLTSSLNLLCCSLWTLPHVLSPHISAKEPDSIFSVMSYKKKNKKTTPTQYVAVWSHWNQLFLQLNKPISLSLSSRVFQLPHHLSNPPLTCLPFINVFPVLRVPKLGTAL